MQLKWHGTTQQTTVLQALITTCSLIPTWKCTLAHFLNFLVISNCPPNFRVYRKCLRIVCDSHETSIEMHWVLFIVVLPLKWCWHESCWKAVWSYAWKVSCFLPPGQVGIPWEVLTLASVREEGTDPACDVRPTRTTILLGWLKKLMKIYYGHGRVCRFCT